MLTVVGVCMGVSCSEKPLIRRMYRPAEYEQRKAAAERTWSNEKWIPDEVRDRMIMRNLHVLKINMDGQRMYKETIKRVSTQGTQKSPSGHCPLESWGHGHQKPFRHNCAS